MSMDISITLSDADLSHFVDGMRQAQERARGLKDIQVIDAARGLIAQTRGVAVPDFVGARLARLETMIAMVEDIGFGLPDEDRARVLAALTYFANPNDIIPDTVPVLGFLDDAIMIELCVRELHHELEAYEDFRDWRAQEAQRHGEDPAKLMLKRVDWAEARRVEAIERMRRRRRDAYAGGSWQPVLFRVS